MARRDKVLTRRNGITRIIFSLYLFDIFGTVAHTRSNNYIPTFPSIPLAYLVLARPPHPTRSFVYLFISFEGLFYSWVKVERCCLACPSATGMVVIGSVLFRLSDITCAVLHVHYLAAYHL